MPTSLGDAGSRETRGRVAGARTVIVRVVHLFGPVLSIVAIVALWQAFVAVTHVSSLVLPAPSTVALAGVANAGLLLTALPITAEETAVGFGVGVTAGVLVAIVISESGLARRLIMPALIVSQVIPVVVLAPMFLIWFGFGIVSKAGIAALICFFPVVVNVTAGLGSLPNEMVELGESVASGRIRIVVKLRFPNALPYLFASLRPAVTLATIGAVVGEFLAGNEGLGALVVRYVQFLDVPAMFATVAVIILMGLALYSLVELASIPVLRWHRAALARAS